MWSRFGDENQCAVTRYGEAATSARATVDGDVVAVVTTGMECTVTRDRYAVPGNGVTSMATLLLDGQWHRYRAYQPVVPVARDRIVDTGRYGAVRVGMVLLVDPCLQWRQSPTITGALVRLPVSNGSMH